MYNNEKYSIALEIIFKNIQGHFDSFSIYFGYNIFKEKLLDIVTKTKPHL